MEPLPLQLRSLRGALRLGGNRAGAEAQDRGGRPPTSSGHSRVGCWVAQISSHSCISTPLSGRPPGPRMPCGWGCGAQLTATRDAWAFHHLPEAAIEVLSESNSAFRFEKGRSAGENEKKGTRGAGCEPRGHEAGATDCFAVLFIYCFWVPCLCKSTLLP